MAVSTLDSQRLQQLTEHLLSPAVQVPEPTSIQDVPADLSAKEVQQVFRTHVPGVEHFRFRDSRHPSLKFIVSAYQEGLGAFRDTPVHEHLRALLRLIVHHGRDGGTGAAAGLREVAEGFMECQAVQARTIERVGLRLHGVVPDFKGQVTRLVGNYKTLSIKMLAVDRLSKGLAMDLDQNPTHYENRLTADLGNLLGLDADAVRLASLDGHAASRFDRLRGSEARAAAARCRELFDVVALLQAFTAEANGLSEESPPESFPRQFLCWAAENLKDKHVVFDEATCSSTEINAQFALSVIESLFLGAPSASGETYRGMLVSDLFQQGVSRARERSSQVAFPEGKSKNHKTNRRAGSSQVSVRHSQQPPHNKKSKAKRSESQGSGKMRLPRLAKGTKRRIVCSSQQRAKRKRA